MKTLENLHAPLCNPCIPHGSDQHSPCGGLGASPLHHWFSPSCTISSSFKGWALKHASTVRTLIFALLNFIGLRIFAFLFLRILVPQYYIKYIDYISVLICPSLGLTQQTGSLYAAYVQHGLYDQYTQHRKILHWRHSSLTWTEPNGTHPQTAHHMLCIEYCSMRWTSTRCIVTFMPWLLCDSRGRGLYLTLYISTYVHYACINSHIIHAE